MATLSIQYIAGFFDADGCVVTAIKEKGATVGISFSQKDPEVLELIRDFFGLRDEYTSKPTKIYPQGNGGYSLTVTGAKRTIVLLEMLLPYLVVKRKQAETAIELASRIRNRIGRDGRSITNEEVAIRKALAQSIRDYNHDKKWR